MSRRYESVPYQNGGYCGRMALACRYSPCMICCSDSVVRGMFVVLAESRQERKKNRGL